MKTYLTLILFFLSMMLFSQTTPGKYTVKSVKINTKDSEFGTTFYGKGKVVYAAPKDNAVITRTVWNENKQAFLDLYIGTIMEDGEIDGKQRVLGDVNNKFHEGIVSFTKDLKTVYFDANNYTSKKKAKKDSTGTVNIQLYKANVGENGSWTNVVKLPFNNDEYSTGHPALSLDDKKLYMISDRPGSVGKTDIFVVDINDDGSYGKPKNLGPRINTEDREMFPFISDKNILYFSSDGHKGYGELDIFASRVFDTTISEAINLEKPINSEKDDFAYIINDENNRGYFSSNREGGKGDDDIYALVADPPIRIEGKQAISGIVKDIDTDQIIPGTTITLLDIDGIEIEKQTIPTDIEDDWKPFTNTDSDGSIKTTVEDIRNTKIDVKITVDNETPEVREEVEFIVVVSNIGRRTAKGIDVKDILPVGYTYVIDDNFTIYNEEKDVVRIDELKKEQKKVVKIKAIVLPASKGAFSFDVKSDTDYKVVIDAPGYMKKEVDVKTDNDTHIAPLDIGVKMDPELRLVDEKIMININTIYFDFDKWNIRLDAAKELDKVIAVMKDHPSMLIEGGSHTDSRATEAYNERLSAKRAKATMDYIIAGGIDASRITSKGYGERQLVNNCSSFVKGCTRAQHQLNRRTEFVIVNDSDRFVSTAATLDNVVLESKIKAKISFNKEQKNHETLNVPLNELPYHLIAGAFRNPKNAIKKVNQLKRLGYKARILGSNGRGLTHVTFDSYDNKQQALNSLSKIRKEVDKSAWLLVREFSVTNPDQNNATEATIPKETESNLNEQTGDLETTINQDNLVSNSHGYIKIAPIYFGFDKWSLSNGELLQLDNVVKIMKENPAIVVEAGAHTDSKNIEAYNQILSDKRAKSVVNYILSKGIDPSRISGKGYGESRYVNRCRSFIKCSANEQQENRRIEFMIIDGNGYPEQDIIGEENKRINTNPIYFDYDKYDIRKDAAYELNRVIKILQEQPTMVIEAGSHTDSNNTEVYNQSLSENRAKSVKEYIVSRGIDSNRIQSKGYGEMQLTNQCKSFVKCTPQEHQANRRTEFKIVKM